MLEIKRHIDLVHPGFFGSDRGAERVADSDAHQPGGHHFDPGQDHSISGNSSQVSSQGKQFRKRQGESYIKSCFYTNSGAQKNGEIATTAAAKGEKPSTSDTTMVA